MAGGKVLIPLKRRASKASMFYLAFVGEKKRRMKGRFHFTGTGTCQHCLKWCRQSCSQRPYYCFQISMAKLKGLALIYFPDRSASTEALSEHVKHLQWADQLSCCFLLRAHAQQKIDKSITMWSLGRVKVVSHLAGEMQLKVKLYLELAAPCIIVQGQKEVRCAHGCNPEGISL